MEGRGGEGGADEEMNLIKKKKQQLLQSVQFGGAVEPRSSAELGGTAERRV